VIVAPSRTSSPIERSVASPARVAHRPCDPAAEADWPWLEAHLGRVSRSFSFCIVRLQPPLRDWVGVSYLLLRLLDTVEDSCWPEPEARARSFDAFERLLDGADEGAAARWAASLPDTVTPAEGALAKDAPRLFRAVHRLPAAARAEVARTARCMGRGMRHFLERPGAGDLALSTPADVDRYCFFVAGIIGELLSRLLAVARPGVDPTADVLLDAHRFGRFLQKINILKDAADDAAAGRLLAVPGVAETVRGDAEGALAYLLRIPPASADYRVFCGWSLFLGLWTFGLPRGSGAERPSRREEAARLLGEVEAVVRDDAALVARFRALAAGLPPGAPERPDLQDDRGDDGAWLPGLYDGALTVHHLVELGVVAPSVAAAALRPERR
jgi:phytoene/squalene synthetase